MNSAMDLIALFLVLKVFISYVGKGFLEEFSAVYNKMPEIVKGNGQGMSIHAADQHLLSVLYRWAGKSVPSRCSQS